MNCLQKEILYEIQAITRPSCRKTFKEKPSEGEVVAVGPGEITEDGKIKPMNVKAGDKILFGKWSGTEVKLDGLDLLIMKESDIMGILE